MRPPKRNCRNESSTPSVWRPVKSMAMMWKAKSTAQAMSIRSPEEMESPPEMQSMYMPMRAAAAQSHVLRPTLAPKAIEKMGTKMMYTEVMKPPLPAPEMATPYCCTTEAAAMRKPRRRPDLSAFERYALSPACLLMAGMANGMRTNAPRSILSPLNVKLPTASDDTDWATKLMPHICDVSSRRSPAFRSFIALQV